MSTFITSALALIVTLGILIAFHEFGHFWTARKLGVKVLRFSIGFGKPLWLRRYGPDQTEFVIAAIPLGGFVKMLDERENEVPEEEAHRAFNRQSVWRRFAIVAAGPIFNFIFAIAAFWLMYLIGVPGVAPIIGEVKPDSPAAVAGFHVGDRITEVNGTQTPTWAVVRINMLDAALGDDEIAVRVEDADGNTQQLQLSLLGVPSEVKQKNLLGHLGVLPVRPVLPATLGELSPDGPAALSGLKTGDHILRVDDETVTDWMALVDVVRAHPDQALDIEFERNGVVQSLRVKTASHQTDTETIGRIGAAPSPPGPLPPELMAREEYSLFEGVGVAVAKTWQLSSLTLRMIGKMIVGEVSVKNLSGPITIATYAGYTASAGVTAFLYFLAVVSISLGVLNLLPIPLLDGGHLMYYLVEMVKGKPLSDAVQLKLQHVGIAFLFMLMSLALYNDVMRLFTD
ncbi:MAG: RIP metalloprotease RseP [Gammaproteobacteria bacterium]|nr:RIP metalloprotease RseP [Gammaproteobacteria bacterium]MCF6260026.1 RIP metalloprotease RseP [Gammaproteobacteria bacterium]